MEKTKVLTGTSCLNGKKILLGLTGSIAVYKAVYILRSLVNHGAIVTVVMTASAEKFVSPLTFSVLSGRQAEVDMFASGGEMAHIEAAKKSDLVLVAPATANIIGKAASAIADDLLSTILVSSLDKTLFAPAMDLDMWKSPLVAENIARLKKYGCSFVGPESGKLASGMEGTGRLASLDAIVDAVVDFFYPCGDELSGVRVVVTAGPTREYIDPVRFVSNRSSGKMGFALAREAKRRKADVTLITGPVSLDPPPGVSVVKVETASHMKEAIDAAMESASLLVMSAAVSDFKPVSTSRHKIKKDSSREPSLKMEATADILKTVSLNKRQDQLLIGFAAETENLFENGVAKLKSKDLDLIIINDVSEEGAGFEADTNKVTVIDKQLNRTEIPLMSKSELARQIFGLITALAKNKKCSPL